MGVKLFSKCFVVAILMFVFDATSSGPDCRFK